MGDVADAMLDGDLCQCCGEYMEGGDGYPRTCAGCQRESKQPPTAEFIACPHCGKRVKGVGLAQHVAAKHSAPKGASHVHD